MLKITMIKAIEEDIAKAHGSFEDWANKLPPQWEEPVFHLGQASLYLKRFLDQPKAKNRHKPGWRTSHRHTQLLLAEIQLLAALKLTLRGHDFTPDDADELRIAKAVGGKNVASALELIYDSIAGIARHLAGKTGTVALTSNIYSALWRVRQELVVINDKVLEENKSGVNKVLEVEK